jgi:hypothetical protein
MRDSRVPSFRTFLLIGLSIATCSAVVPGMANAVDWYDAAWSYRQSMSASTAELAPAEILADFPLCVILDQTTHPEVFANARADGFDLRFTLEDGTTLLDHELVRFDPSAGRAEAWVRVPSFSATQHTIYMYFGNALAGNSSNPAATWTTATRAMYHFDNDPASGILEDSSPHAAHCYLTPESGWTSSDRVDARVGRGWYYNGTTHHTRTRDLRVPTTSYTFSAWLENVSKGTDFFLHADPGYWKVSSQASDTSDSPDFGDQYGSVKWLPRITLNDGFHHFAWTFDDAADTIIFYFDGVPQPVWAKFPADFSPFYQVSRQINPAGNYFIGILGNIFPQVVIDYHEGGADEFRIRDGALSPGWIATEVANQSDPVSFFALSEVESQTVTSVGPSHRTRVSLYPAEPNPMVGQTSIRFVLADSGAVTLSVFDAAGRLVVRILDESLPAGSHARTWNGRDSDGQSLAMGVYFVVLEASGIVDSTKLVLVP